MKYQSKGFTLIELIIVITILGVLAAVALPRFSNVSDKAHQASVAGAGGALAAAVALTHSQWIANGFSSGADVDDLIGFGNDDVNMTTEGWPRGTTGTANGTTMSANLCLQIWNGLLQSGAPFVSTAAGANVEYLAGVSGDLNGANDDCLFTYQQGNGHTIRYDADLGEVRTTLN